ncbi:MAG: nuclear transport factor 2 family protein [Spirosomataceae bacterium]
MKISLFSLVFFVISVQVLVAQQTIPTTSNIKDEQTVLQLSKDKWQWMADKDVDKLKGLFDAKAKFVHMSGTWKTDEELEIIKTGSIWYKEAKVHDTAIEMAGKTAIVWNRITLVANVRGNDVTTEFTVTEVYQKQGKAWKMLALTFSSVRDTHQIKK